MHDGGQVAAAATWNMRAGVRLTIRAAALASAGLLAACGGGTGSAPASASSPTVVPAGSTNTAEGAVPTPTATPVPTPTPTPVQTSIPTGPKFEVGINVSSSVYYSTERTFANLVYKSSGWNMVGADGLLPSGYPISAGRIYMVPPQAVWAGTTTKVTCTWKGAGKMFVDGNRSGEVYGDHYFTVNWKPKGVNSAGSMFINFSGGSASDPLRDLDCREAGVVANGPFDQRVIDDLKPYGVLRFLDWSAANSAAASITWDKRATPDNLAQNGTDNVAIETMVDLANAAGSDAWFTIPYNADETYIRNMAKLVHDRLASNHRAYFELSNEVWNFAFPAATQALNEGLAENLSTDKYTNNLLRYAEKSVWMHRMLTEAFADNPTRLVRVLGVQSGNDWGVRVIFNFRDTAKWIDAVATAPYFGHGLLGATVTETDLSNLFATLEAGRVKAIAGAVRIKAETDKRGMRSIAYEAGQHIVPVDGDAAKAATAAEMQRSNVMYDIYKRYLADWKSQIGDTMVMYAATGSISKYGAWGIREYGGQPLSETPKRRAVLEHGR